MRKPKGLTWTAFLLFSATLLVNAPGRVAASSLTGAINVSLGSPVRSVNPTLLGLNGVNVTGPRWDNSSLDAALNRFAPGVVRYPGGTAANYWSWPAGWFQPGSWPGEPSGQIDDTLPVFGSAPRAAGATVLFDLNTVTYQGGVAGAAQNAAMLDDQLNLLRAAAAQGLPVKMVELGNELYLNGYSNSPPNPNEMDYAKRFPTAGGYATQMNPWIAAIHQAFPGVKVAAVATDANDVNGINSRRLTWNAGVLPLLQGADAVTIHENQRVTSTSASVANVLAMPYLHFQKLKAHELSLFQSYGLPVWITEFNLADMTSGQLWRGTWLNGLFVAEQALLFLSEPAIAYAGLNATAGDAHTAIFANKQGFGKGGPSTVPFALTAAGTTVSMIQAALRRASAAQPLSFSAAPSLGATGAPALLGEALTTSAGPELVLVNLSSAPVTLNLSAVYAAGCTATQVYAPSAKTLVTGPGSTEQSSSPAVNQVTVQPYAIADVTPSAQPGG